MTERNNFDLLCEDFQLGSNNALGVGDSGMALKPEQKQFTFLDLMDQLNKMKDDPGKAGNVTPYPIQYNVNEDLADAYVRVAEAKGKFRQALNNPVVGDNPKAKKTTIKLYKKAEKIQEIIKSIAEDLDDLAV